jgi:hypothetical protein
MSNLPQDLKHLVHEQWLRLRVRGAEQRLRERAIRRAIERAVSQANPRIRGLTGYRDRLHNAIADCLEYAKEIAERIPGPVTVNRQTWLQDRLIRALFGDPNRILWALSSNDCRDYMNRSALKTGDCYGLLMAHPVFRKQLGMDLSGDTIQRDIQQTTLSFDNIDVIMCSSDPQKVRAKATQGIMDALVGFAAKDIGRQQERIDELEERLRIVRIKQKVVSPSTHGLEILRDGGLADTTQYKILGRQIKELEKELAESHQGLSTLNDYLDRLIALLQHPETLVAARFERVRLDRMNVLRPDREDGGQSAEIEFLRAYSGERAGRMALMVRFAREDLVTDQDWIAQAERYVNI